MLIFYFSLGFLDLLEINVILAHWSIFCEKSYSHLSTCLYSRTKQLLHLCHNLFNREKSFHEIIICPKTLCLFDIGILTEV